MTAVSWDIAVAVAFAVGVLLFGISSAMLRSAQPKQRPELLVEPPSPPPALPPPPPPAWPEILDPDLHDASDELRLDIIERLSMISAPWTRELLERARNEEHDPSIIAAIDRAL
jgi:hypothetical protein